VCDPKFFVLENEKRHFNGDFGGLNVTYTDINRLILEYATVSFSGKAIKEIEMNYCYKMTYDQTYLYICQWSSFCITRFTLNNLLPLDQFKLTSYPGAIDIFEKELYVYDWHGSITVFDINTKNIIRRWFPPTASISMKIHNKNLYYCGQDDIIYVYTLFGESVNQFGGTGKGNGELSNPLGIDIDKKFIYVCDYTNARIQVFDLEKYFYHHKWGSKGIGDGQFTYPCELRLYENTCYVGDQHGIQIFTLDGTFLNRFGKTFTGKGIDEFNSVRGILMIDDRLYISDTNNSRLLVLE